MSVLGRAIEAVPGRPDSGCGAWHPVLLVLTDDRPPAAERPLTYANASTKGRAGFAGQERSQCARNDQVTGLRQLARTARNWWERSGPPQSSHAIQSDAQAYWRDEVQPGWRSNSHWREGVQNLWDEIGASSLTLAERLARITGERLPSSRTVEWGSGGGANAVRFAARCEEFVAVDISQASLDECERQVSRVTSTPVRKVLIDVATPETAIAEIGPGSCDLFLCLYVMELVPSQSYGLRLLDIAARLLAPAGVALVQTKYSTTTTSSRSRRRAYRRDLANMTTFPIDQFWIEADNRGLRPLCIALVPRDNLDERYAYYLLVRDPS
jgi:2-polyprenyl-3-methyl-5-hydroxy-6-metoxy-1,4-benzoquinol methylase